MQCKKKDAYTLLEVLICLLLIVIFCIAAVSLSKPDTQEYDSDRLLQLLKFARNKAILQQKRLTICPYNEQYSCGDNWHQGLILMGDKKLLRILKIKNITWRGFPRKDRVYFYPSGLSSNGRFQLKNISIILNRAGRARLE